ncbi:hypothetical protein ACC691_36175, partial [Rhizobium johnstonii]
MTATIETPREARPPQSQPSPARRKAARRRALVPYMMLLPGIILFLAFMAAPIFYTLYLSFQKTVVKGLGLGSGARSQVFAGFENYLSSLT